MGELKPHLLRALLLALLASGAHGAGCAHDTANDDDSLRTTSDDDDSSISTACSPLPELSHTAVFDELVTDTGESLLISGRHLRPAPRS